MRPWAWARIGQWSVWVLVVFVGATSLAVTRSADRRARNNAERLEDVKGQNEELQGTIDALSGQVRSLGATPVSPPSSTPSERISYVPVPGPSGPVGVSGKDGRDGRDGRDGAAGAGGPAASLPRSTTTTTIPRRCIVNPDLCVIEVR